MTLFSGRLHAGPSVFDHIITHSLYYYQQSNSNYEESQASERSPHWERKHSRDPWWVPVELHQRQEVAQQVQTIREAEPGHRLFRVIIG